VTSSDSSPWARSYTKPRNRQCTTFPGANGNPEDTSAWLTSSFIGTSQVVDGCAEKKGQKICGRRMEK